MDPHMKMLIALIVTCATLGAVILSLLCLWFYHKKYKFHRKNARSSGNWICKRHLLFLNLASKFVGLIMFVNFCLIFYCCVWCWCIYEDVEKELASSPFFGKFDSIKMVGKKGSVTVIEYKLLEKGTSNFRESNILGEGGFGCVYRARLDENLLVAVKKLDCASQDAEKEFEVLFVWNMSTCS